MPQNIQRYRSIFISDFHIGAKSFDARALLNFLRSSQADKLYLVGDIFDGWKLNKRWHWDETCSQIIDELIQQAHQGTQITYLPGNHDEEIRRIPAFTRHLYAHRLGIKIRDKAIHTLADGRRCLVLHGDQFDRKILSGPLSRWSDQLYDWLLDMLGAHSSENTPKIIHKGDIRPFSLAKYLSKHGQKALNMLNNFEKSIYKRVKRNGLDGLICGHTHIPALKHIRGVLYANPGDWIRSGHHALVEKFDGDLELLEWPCSQSLSVENETLFKEENAPEIYSAYQFRDQTKRIVRELQRIWPEKKPQPSKENIRAVQPKDMCSLFLISMEKACKRIKLWAMADVEPVSTNKKES